jgi:hypothetical protein
VRVEDFLFSPTVLQSSEFEVKARITKTSARRCFSCRRVAQCEFCPHGELSRGHRRRSGTPMWNEIENEKLNFFLLCAFKSRKTKIFFFQRKTKPNDIRLFSTIEIWLILPVVICLFQGLSHACLRITALQESAHGSLHQTQSAAKMLRSNALLDTLCETPG